MQLISPGIGDSLCVAAYGAGQEVFREVYPADREAGSLVFLEGDLVVDEVRVIARSRQAGRVVAGAAGTADFAAPGESILRLDLARCVPGDGVASAARLITNVPRGGRLHAVDADGDGQDELLAGSRLFEPADGSTIALMSVLGDALTIVDDNDDCRDDIVTQNVIADLVTDRPTAITLEPGAVVVRANAGDGARLYTGSASGFGPLGGSINAAPVTALVAGDLDGDGDDELIASGPAGIAAWRGTAGGPSREDAILPAAIRGEPHRLAIADVDGDGSLDVVALGNDELKLLLNRGDGFLELRPTATVPGLTAVGRLIAGDVDGDCLADVVVVQDVTARIFLSTGTTWVEGDLGDASASEVTLADVDGDGAKELVAWRPNGDVVSW